MNKKEEINTISYIQLLNESIEMYEILFALIKLDKEVSSLLSLPMIPFLAFIVDGIIQVFSEGFDYSKKNFNLDSDSFKKLVRKIRVGHKLLSDKRSSQKRNIIKKNKMKTMKI